MYLKQEKETIMTTIRNLWFSLKLAVETPLMQYRTLKAEFGE